MSGHEHTIYKDEDVEKYWGLPAEHHWGVMGCSCVGHILMQKIGAFGKHSGLNAYCNNLR